MTNLCKSVRNTLLCVLRGAVYSTELLFSRYLLRLILSKVREGDFDKAMAGMKNPARWPGFLQADSSSLMRLIASASFLRDFSSQS